MSDAAGTVLIVDDNRDNLRLLYDVLVGAGHTVLVATDGPTALARLEHATPELLMLDVMMPGMDGFELLRRIREDGAAAGAPAVFMSALTDPQDRVAGLEAGAADFISKPVDGAELLARVSTQLQIGRLNRGLQERNGQLQAFAYMVAHDLKSPLGLVRMALARIDDLHPDADPDAARRSLGRAIRGADDCMATVDALLLLAESAQRTKMATVPVDMQALLAAVLDGATGQLAQHVEATLEVRSLPPALGYGPWLRQVWSNLLHNAFKYAGPAPRVVVDAVGGGPASLRYRVRDYGPGLQPGQLESLFQPFERRHGDGAPGHGLGLSLVRQVVERLGGQAAVELPPDGGCLFWFELPRPRDAAD